MKEQGKSAVEAQRLADPKIESLGGGAAQRTVGGPAPSGDWLLRAAVVFAALVLLAAGAIVYWMAPDEPSHVGVPPLPTTDMSRDEIIKDLVNRGLIPSQTLDATPRSSDEIIRDLVNRGLIPSQALDAAPSD